MGPTEIANRALSQVGARSAITNFDEPSKEAQQCALWYDTLRRQLLRGAHWGFSRAQAPLSELGNMLDGTSPYPWPFKYTYPADALKMRYILPPTPGFPQSVVGVQAQTFGAFAPSRANKFLVANDWDEDHKQRRVVLANLQFAQAVYTVDVTDVNMMDDLFQQALVALLGAHICIPLTGNKDVRRDQLEIAMVQITAARVADGNEAIPTTDHVPDWIAARGISNSQIDNFPYGSWFLPYEQLSWGG